MRKTLLLFLISISPCLFQSCDEIASEALALRYLTVFDTSGTTILRIHLELDTSDQTNITGTWEVKETLLDTLPFFANQSSGKLSGAMPGSKLNLDFSPEWRDNNLVFIGTETWDGYYGDWPWISISGGHLMGTFSLLRSGFSNKP